MRYRVNRRVAGGNGPALGASTPSGWSSSLWGFQKTRYRGIAKNLARAQTMFALANLYAHRDRLLPPEARCVL